MTGRINDDYEAVVEVEVRSSGGKIGLSAVIDTGSSEFLMLPSRLLYALGAVQEDEMRVTLGDGSVALLDVYVVAIEWLGEWRSVRTLASEGDALIGMRLLEGHDLQMRIVPHGDVRLTPL